MLVKVKQEELAVLATYSMFFQHSNEARHGRKKEKTEIRFVPIVAFLGYVLFELSKCDAFTRNCCTIRDRLVAKIVADDCLDTGWIDRQFFTGSSEIEHISLNYKSATAISRHRHKPC
jgi:hypothetical protein